MRQIFSGSKKFLIGLLFVGLSVLFVVNNASLGSLTADRIWLFNIILLVMFILLLAWLIKFELAGNTVNKDLATGIMLTLCLLLFAESVFFALNLTGTSHLTIYSGALNQPDELLGYKPIPNNQTRVIKENREDGRIIFDAVYSTDAYGRRTTPLQNLENRTNFIIFLGGSFTFGLGVNDNETLPFYTAQFASKYTPYNYGVNGHGPQQMLAKLQSDELLAEIPEEQGILIYTFIDHHINRAIGDMRWHLDRGYAVPYYTIDSEDNLVRKGTLVSGRPFTSLVYTILGTSQTLQYFKLNLPKINDEHYRQTARILEESRNVFEDKFGSEDFYILLYPGNGEKLKPYLEKANVKYLDYSHLFDPSQTGFTIEGDGHPTPQAHKIIAEQLTRDLGIYDYTR